MTKSPAGWLPRNRDQLSPDKDPHPGKNITTKKGFIIVFSQLYRIVLYKKSLKHWSQNHVVLMLSILKNLPFLKVFSSIAICPLLRLISWNLTTRCLAVTGDGSAGECARLRQPTWLLSAYQWRYEHCTDWTFQAVRLSVSLSPSDTQRLRFSVYTLR